ncbi:hypothetical protein [Serratia marcescens]|nr:hypothetical protein [Serratia marcescens]
MGCDVSESLELISNAFDVIETRRPKVDCNWCVTSSPCHQGSWPAS